MMKKILIGLSSLLVVAVAVLAIYLTTGFNFALDEFSKTFKDYRSDQVHSTAIENQKPFSVLLIGADTGTGTRAERWEGNSDSLILVTVNPQTQQTTMTSLERDILVDIADEDGASIGNQTKLNAAYAIGGAKMAISTVEQLLDIKIDHYVQINMQGLIDLVDAVGGITVTNEFNFPIRIDEWEPEYTAQIQPGTHKINGEQALVYSRMRYDDPEGDYGRQRRQRQVIQKILQKLLSFDGVSNYTKVLKAISKNMQTDIPVTSKTLPNFLVYKDVVSNLKSYQLKGEDADLEDGSYQAVTSTHLLETQNRIKKELGLATSTTLTTSALLYEDLFGLLHGSVESEPIQSDEELLEESADVSSPAVTDFSGVVYETPTYQGTIDSSSVYQAPSYQEPAVTSESAVTDGQFSPIQVIPETVVEVQPSATPESESSYVPAYSQSSVNQ